MGVHLRLRGERTTLLCREESTDPLRRGFSTSRSEAFVHAVEFSFQQVVAYYYPPEWSGRGSRAQVQCEVYGKMVAQRMQESSLKDLLRFFHHLGLPFSDPTLEGSRRGYGSL